MATVLSLAVVVTACGTTTNGASSGLRVVATTSVWGDVISQIAGDDADVEVLIPRGSDAHDYDPTPRQIASLQEADLVVANGLGLEGGFEDLLESAAEDGANVLELAPELDPLPFSEQAHEGEEDAHEQGSLDPHVWFDPSRVDTAVHLIADRLAGVDDSVDWESRADEYSDRLSETDEEVTAILGTVPTENRKLVTNHDAFEYFADRYEFEVIAVVIPGGSTLGDPSSAEMAALVDEMQHEGIRTIFAETSQPSALAEAVAAEVGEDVEVVELYTGSLGEPGSGADTLTGMLVTNADRIADALGE